MVSIDGVLVRQSDAENAALRADALSLAAINTPDEMRARVDAMVESLGGSEISRGLPVTRD